MDGLQESWITVEPDTDPRKQFNETDTDQSGYFDDGEISSNHEVLERPEPESEPADEAK